VAQLKKKRDAIADMIRNDLVIFGAALEGRRAEFANYFVEFVGEIGVVYCVLHHDR
jgi:hypothetical protein